MSQTNLQAVEAAIAASGDALTAAHGPLLELVRALARQMDTAGENGPSSRLSAAYLSALKDFGRIASAPRGQGAAPGDDLEAFRRRKKKA